MSEWVCESRKVIRNHFIFIDPSGWWTTEFNAFFFIIFSYIKSWPFFFFFSLSKSHWLVKLCLRDCYWSSNIWLHRNAYVDTTITINMMMPVLYVIYCFPSFFFSFLLLSQSYKDVEGTNKRMKQLNDLCDNAHYHNISPFTSGFGKISSFSSFHTFCFLLSF